jgi:Family of unknown function (DUF5714)
MTVVKRQESCLLCGASFEPSLTGESITCTSCGAVMTGAARCPEGHALCEACRGREVRRIFERITLAEHGQDAGTVAEQMLSHPALPMLGCEHAFAAAGALLAALRNSPYGRITEQEVREVFDRTEKQARSGYCGLTGVCGVTPAVGAVLSVFLGARLGSDREQRIVMEAVTRVSRAITDLTGPSCCKAYVRAALGVAVPFLAEQFGMVLPSPASPPVCGHAERHPHGCREELCPFYRRPAQDLFGGVRFVPGTACVT